MSYISMSSNFMPAISSVCFTSSIFSQPSPTPCVASPGFAATGHETKRKQDRQALLKAKYCPRAVPVQHFTNPGQLVQAVSCTQKHTKNHVTYDL